MAAVISLRLVLTVLFLVILRTIKADCYYPNGQVSSDGDQPCSSESESACCPLNWQCLSNGLCYLENESYLGRYTCTDKTWSSESCPKICTHNNTASGNEAVLECNSGTYCCDANRPDVGGGLGCCDTSNDFFTLPAGSSIFFIGIDAPATSTLKLVPILSPTQLTSSSSSDPSTTTTSTGSSSSAPENNGIVGTPSRADTSVLIITSVVINSASSISRIITLTTAVPQSTAIASSPASTQTSSPKNLGIKTGVGVGVPVGVLALAALIYFLWRRQKKRSSLSSMEYVPTDPDQIEYMYKNNADLDSPYTATTESPEIDQRASGNTFSMGNGPGEYRGVSASLGMHPTTPELPDSPSRLSELSGSSPRQRESRNLQMSELAGSSRQPCELP